jgi:hypothetical protein
MGAVLSALLAPFGLEGLRAQDGSAFVVLDDLAHSGTRYLAGPGQSGAGRALAPAGDANGDGLSDLILGVDGLGVSLPGRAYLVPGGRPLPGDLPLPGLSRLGVTVESGLGTADGLGAVVASAGDVDADGLDDLLVVASLRTPPGPGGPGVFLVFGSPRLELRVRLADLFERPGEIEFAAVLFRSQVAMAPVARAAAGIGDVNDDGFDDFALGFPEAAVATPEGRVRLGKVLVVFGGAHLRAERMRSLDGLAPPLGLEILGPEADAEFGASVAGLGDLDLDGTADFAAGSPGQGQGGHVHVFFGAAGLASPPVPGGGPAGQSLDLVSALAGSRFGHSVAGGADVDGDGGADLVAGAPQGARRAGGTPIGFVVLIPGGPELRQAASIEVPNALTPYFTGTSASEAGFSVAMVPDRSGDGIAELLVGAPGKDSGSGAVYLAYGSELFSGETFLEDLGPESGLRLQHRNQRPRLGTAVAGLADRNGDGRGDLVVGAPVLRLFEGGGAVYEFHGQENHVAPQDLECSVLPGARVLLTWSVPRLFRQVRVYRDGQPLAAPFPDEILRYIDTAPGPGRHEYFVETSGGPDMAPPLRSPPCVAEVVPLGLLDFSCRQIPGTTTVRAAWRPGDFYAGLRFTVDGSAAPGVGVLPPTQTVVEIPLPAGSHRIEVFALETLPDFDPADDVLVARCDVNVLPSELPAVTGFTCAVIPDSDVDVRLAWNEGVAFSSYVLLRGGLPLARVSSTSFVDATAPEGTIQYEVVGLSRDGLHQSPASRCTVSVPPRGVGGIAGRVVFDDSAGTPLRRGRVLVYSAAQADHEGPIAPLGRTQVNESGEFRVATTGPGPFRLEFEAELVDADGDPLHGDDGAIESLRGVLRTESSSVAAGSTVTLAVPLPVLALSPAASDLRRWSTFQNLVSLRRLTLVMAVAPGAASGALRVERTVLRLAEVLEAQVGSAPAQVDMVAYGFAGLAARLYAHTRPERGVRRLVLLGTPNLGTPRAEVEARSDLAARPPPGGVGDHAAPGFEAADEQTAVFLREFNERVTGARGAEVYLVAGTAGRPQLDRVLGCDDHDGRVCDASALAAAPGAFVYLVGEDHESLGRGAASTALVRSILDAAEPLLALAAQAPEGGGAGVEGSELGLGKVVDGVLQPGGDGTTSFVSDTSGSIIIILVSDDEGGVTFSIVTPSGVRINPSNAGANGIEYLTYNDGEGHVVQSYRFPFGEVGTYAVDLVNTSSVAIAYSLEMRVESPLVLAAALDRDDLEPLESPTLTAELVGLDPQVLPVVTLSARVLRPSGAQEFLSLRDDGAGADEIAGDGVFTVEVPPSSEAGSHLVEVSASDGPSPSFERAATLQFLVRSGAASLGESWSSGVEDLDSDGLSDRLWVDGTVLAQLAGVYLVSGRLVDLSGGPVAQAAVLFAVEAPGAVAVRLPFDGSEIRSSGRDGPYVVAEAELLDGGVGFVRADLGLAVHTTQAYSWMDFGIEGGLAFRRGDVNEDGAADLSDAVSILHSLFQGGFQIACRDAADINTDAEIDISDPLSLLNFLFVGGPPVPPPGPENCGQDEVLGCASYDGCV